ncbi:MAG: hypothetical protein Q7S71_02195 [Candidatus Nitrotoga sp.]|nr:hypothetical protein [Candidatus Nitrotoga sp.]
MAVDWEYWLQIPVWTHEQFILLSVGKDPAEVLEDAKLFWGDEWLGTESLIVFEPEKKRYRIVMANINFGSYPVAYSYDNRYAEVKNAIAWAIERSWELPDEMMALLDTKQKSPQHAQPINSPHTFDKETNTYPPELDIAIQAWRAVSSDEGKGKPKARIKAWLYSNTTLSSEAKERIATVVNWDKTGGATRSD